MTARKLLTTLALFGSVALAQLPAHAADPSVTAPESPTRELKVHDQAPDIYTRDEMALRGWQELYKKNLARFAPVDASAGAALRARWTTDPDALVMVSNAGTDGHKGWIDLVEAIATLPEPIRSHLHVAVAGRDADPRAPSRGLHRTCRGRTAACRRDRGRGGCAGQFCRHGPVPGSRGNVETAPSSAA